MINACFSCATGSECTECNSIPDCGFCFMDDPVQGVIEGACLLANANQTSVSDYGACSNVSISV